MKLRTITSRAVVAGATTALAAGALVAASAPANAATVDNTYTCTIAAQTFDSTLTVTGELPVPQYWAGAAVPEGLLNVTASVDEATAGQLAGYGATELRVDDFAFDLSGSTVPVPLSGPIAEGSWNGSGSNEPFVTPNPGVASALMPAAMTVTAVIGGIDVSGPCTLAEGEEAQTLASIELLKQSSETLADDVTAKKGRKVVVPVAVNSTSLGGPVSGGKVVAKKGKKTLDSAKLKNGKAKLNLGKKFKVGKTKVTVMYKGIPSVGASSDKITVTIKKN